MEISRHPLTGQSVLATRPRDAMPSHPVQVTCSGAGFSTSVWLTPGEALAIAAVALGVPHDYIEQRASRIDFTMNRKHWDPVELADVIAEVFEVRHVAEADLLAAIDEAEAAAVERP